MHSLILLRHAQALRDSPDGSDMTRPLSESGCNQADAAGRWLRAHNARPGRILYSPATRTTQTAQRVAQMLDDAPMHVEAAIHDATAGELVTLLDAHREIDQLLLVGHNPGLEHLLGLLMQGRSNAARGLPPAGLAWLTLEGALEPGCGELKAYWEP